MSTSTTNAELAAKLLGITDMLFVSVESLDETLPDLSEAEDQFAAAASRHISQAIEAINFIRKGLKD